MTGADAQLPCFGCAHSAAMVPFPGQPAGERPCMFCVRNPDRERWNADFAKQHGMRYDDPACWNDGTPMTKPAPLDMYIALDRLMEERDLRKVAASSGCAPQPTIEDAMAQMHEALAKAPPPMPPSGSPRAD